MTTTKYIVQYLEPSGNWLDLFATDRVAEAQEYLAKGVPDTLRVVKRVAADTVLSEPSQKDEKKLYKVTLKYVSVVAVEDRNDAEDAAIAAFELQSKADDFHVWDTYQIDDILCEDDLPPWCLLDTCPFDKATNDWSNKTVDDYLKH